MNKQAPSSSWWPLYDHTTQRSPPTYPPRPQRYPLPYPPQSIPKSSPQYHLPNTPRSLSPHIPTPTPHIPTYNVVPTFHPSLAKVQQKGKSRSPTISPSYKAFPSVYTTQSKVQPADNSNSASPEITQPPPYPSTTPVTTDYTMLPNISFQVTQVPNMKPTPVIDQCQSSPSPCGPHATCSTILDQLICTCTDGYTGTPPYFPCEPVDHCSKPSNPCGRNSVCHNSFSGHVCQCLPGYYTWNNKTFTCIDVDECTSMPGLCGDYSHCVNTVGSYQCNCDEGFIKSVETSLCIAE